ncbi:MAG: hypothetical protein R3253_17325, partial [Longimicrobiales bacterium]|nr:hypothetical protein [Longimicrobiales bacterium]
MVAQSPQEARILLVVASDGARRSLIRELQERGWKGLPAGDAVQAQQAARNHQPDVVFIGAKLP